MPALRRSSRIQTRKAYEASHPILPSQPFSHAATRKNNRKAKCSSRAVGEGLNKQRNGQQTGEERHRDKMSRQSLPASNQYPIRMDDRFSFVEFEVGGNEEQKHQTFYINKHHLTQHSTYFLAITAHETSKIIMNGENAEAFAMLHRWIYTQEICDNERRRGWEIDFNLLSDLNVLADKFGMVGLSEQVMDAFTGSVIDLVEEF